MSERNLVSIDSNRIAIAFEPDQERMKAMRLLAAHHGGANVKSENGVWLCTFPITAKDEIAQYFAGVKWSEDFRRLMKGSAAKFQVAEDKLTTRLLKAAGDLSKPLADGRTLYDHQKIGIEWLLKTPRAILGDDMGLGKTLMSLYAARTIHEVTRAHTIVLTKACLIDDWRQEAAKLKHRVVSCYSWAKIPKPTQGHYVLIADEAHLAQSLTSKRGMAFQEWAEVADFVFILTGTPMMNGRHINLFPLLKACAHPLGKSLRDYEKNFCGAKRIVLKAKCTIDDEKFRIRYQCDGCKEWNDQKWHFSWKHYTCNVCGDRMPAPKTFTDKKGATNAATLKTEIAPILLRRLKTECLDLPPKTRVVRQVEITPAMHEMYSQAVQRAKASYRERVASGEVASEGQALAMLNWIREAASMAKAQAAIELAEEVLEAGGQPIVFTEFLNSADAVAKHFKVSQYIGDTDRAKKVQIVKAFQAGEQKVFVGTREAGGTGLNLTAANTIIAIDRPMRPGDIDQAEDRAARIGQRWPLTVYYLRAFPVCDKIDGFIEEKRKAINAVIGDGDAAQSDEISARQVLGSLFEWGKEKKRT